MGTYKSKKFKYATENDEIGFKYSLSRSRNEEIYDYKKRLIHQSRRGISQSISDIGFYLNNSLQKLESGIFKIDRKKDSNGEDLYPFSYFEIDSVYFKIVKNFFEKDEILIRYREFDTYRQLIENINSFDVLECEYLYNVDIDNIGDTYSLKVQTNLSRNEERLTESKFFNLSASNILETLFYNISIFEHEKKSFQELNSAGDYYIDYKNGKIWNYSEMSDTVQYSFANFPFIVKKQPVKINLGIDKSFRHLTQEIIEEEKGYEKRVVLNEDGCIFYKELFKSYPIYWGL